VTMTAPRLTGLACLLPATQAIDGWRLGSTALAWTPRPQQMWIGQLVACLACLAWGRMGTAGSQVDDKYHTVCVTNKHKWFCCAGSWMTHAG
jgi:hypothetical protein